MGLKEALQTLAENFADEVLSAVRGASLDELLGEVGEGHASAARAPRASAHAAPSKSAKPGRSSSVKTGRLARRSLAQIQEAAQGVAKLLRGKKDGLRAEDIRTALSLDVREVPRILQQGLVDKLFRILGGAKRSTTYGLGKGKPAKAAKPARAAKAKARKPAKAAKAKPRKVAKPRKATKPRKAAKSRASKKAHAKAAPKTNHATATAAPAPAAA